MEGGNKFNEEAQHVQHEKNGMEKERWGGGGGGGGEGEREGGREGERLVFMPTPVVCCQPSPS